VDGGTSTTCAATSCTDAVVQLTAGYRPPGTCDVTLVVRDTNDEGRNATAQARFTVYASEESPPQVTALVTASRTPVTPGVYPASMALALSATATGGAGAPYAFLWSPEGTVFNHVRALPCISTENGLPTVHSEACAAAALARRTLVLPGGSLGMGTYTFRLSVRDARGVTGSAAVAFAVVDPPFGGNLTLSNRTVDPTASVTAEATGWVDPAGGNLAFRFFYAAASSSTATAARVYLHGEPMADTSCTFALPIGTFRLGVEVTAVETGATTTFLPDESTVIVCDLSAEVRQKIVADPVAYTNSVLDLAIKAREDGAPAEALRALAQGARVLANALPEEAEDVLSGLLNESSATLAEAEDSVGATGLPTEIVLQALDVVNTAAAARTPANLNTATDILKRCAYSEARQAAEALAATANIEFQEDKLAGFLSAADGLLAAVGAQANLTALAPANDAVDMHANAEEIAAIIEQAAVISGVSAMTGAAPVVSQQATVGVSVVKRVPDLLAASSLAAPAPASLGALAASGATVTFPVDFANLLPETLGVSDPLVVALIISAASPLPAPTLDLGALGSVVIGFQPTAQRLVAPVTHVSIYGGALFNTTLTLEANDATEAANFTSAPRRARTFAAYHNQSQGRGRREEVMYHQESIAALARSGIQTGLPYFNVRHQLRYSDVFYPALPARVQPATSYRRVRSCHLRCTRCRRLPQRRRRARYLRPRPVQLERR